MREELTFRSILEDVAVEDLAAAVATFMDQATRGSFLEHLKDHGLISLDSPGEEGETTEQEEA